MLKAVADQAIAKAQSVEAGAEEKMAIVEAGTGGAMAQSACAAMAEKEEEDSSATISTEGDSISRKEPTSAPTSAPTSVVCPVGSYPYNSGSHCCKELFDKGGSW